MESVKAVRAVVIANESEKQRSIRIQSHDAQHAQNLIARRQAAVAKQKETEFNDTYIEMVKTHIIESAQNGEIVVRYRFPVGTEASHVRRMVDAWFTKEPEWRMSVTFSPPFDIDYGTWNRCFYRNGYANLPPIYPVDVWFDLRAQMEEK